MLSGIITKDTTYLTIDTLPDVGVKKESSSLHMGRYLLNEINGNRYHHRYKE